MKLVDLSCGRVMKYAASGDAAAGREPVQIRTISTHTFFQCMGDKFAVRARSYENTHLEILIADFAMKRFDFRSAIFVSAPYHMRRLRLIAARVLKGRFQGVVFVPSDAEGVHMLTWPFYAYDRKAICREFCKIGYYLGYTYLPFLFIS